MPIIDTDTEVYGYPLARRGVNLYVPSPMVRAEEALLMKNCIFRNGIIKRGGNTKFETDEVTTGKKIVGLHKFYYGAASKQLLVASGTVVKYHDGATWQNVKTGLTDGSQTRMATWLTNCYIANGTDAPHKWSGSVSAAVTAAPSNTKQFLPYQDRLLSITGGDLTWSASFSDATWETVANCGVRPDTQLYGMIYHSISNMDFGFESKVLLGGANGMYLFAGTDLRPPYSTGDYVIYPLAARAGCEAFRTMVWTPKGSIWLGNDKQVYLLPFDSVIPIPVGDKIRSNNAVTEGIEDIPSAQIANASAIYYDGFYILSVVQSGQTTNNAQWWLDIRRLAQDEDGLWGPWYGPMTGMAISCFATQNGAGDGGELMGGESNASTGSYVYQLNQSGVYADVGTAITVQYKTFYHSLGNPKLKKEIPHMELELLDINGTVNIDLYDITGSITTTQSLSLDGGTIKWGQYNWGAFNWSFSNPKRQIVNMSPTVTARKLAISIESNSSIDTFELYDIGVKAVEQREIFA